MGMAANLTEFLLVGSVDALNSSATSDLDSNETSPVLTAMEVAMTPNPAVGPPPVPQYYAETRFACDRVLLPVVCCLGILANGLSLGVLTRREMAAATTCFLTAMAVSDILLLSLQLPTFFGLNEAIANTQRFKLFIRYYTIIRYVLNNVFVTCTCWLTVAVTIERFISLRFMFHPKLICTIPRARVAIISIYVVSFIFHFSKFFEYAPQLDLSSPQPLVGTHLQQNPAYETYVHVTNIALAAIIPVFVLVIANAFLIYFLATHRRRMLRHKVTASANMTSVDMLHVTAIVVATVLVFIACHSIGVFLGLTIAAHPKGRMFVFSNHVYLSLKHINTLLIMVNSSVNFLLYCAISRKFRKTFVTIFFKRMRRRDPWTSAMPLSESNNGGGPPTLPRHGTVYTSSSKSLTANGSSRGSNGYTNAIRADV